MKLAWLSNHPDSPSGYGTQTRQVGRRLVAAGHEVEFITNDGTRGDSLWEGQIVRGSGADRYSRDTAAEDFARSGADWLVSLYDAWVYADRADPFRGIPNVAGWVPVDHNPVPPGLEPWLRSHRTIAMSRYGHDQLTEFAGLLAQEGRGHGLPVWYAPHAIDTHVYRPVDGRAFRLRNAIPQDAFLVGIVAANTGTAIYDRKGFGDMFIALSVFLHEHPDAHAYIHSQLRGYEAMDLEILARSKHLPERLHFVDQHDYVKRSFSDDDMAAIYSGCDVLLSTSRGEGFGMCPLEAMACGTPAIVSNWTAQAEIVGHTFDPRRMGFERHANGWMVSVSPDYDCHQAADFGKPDIAEIGLALREAYAVRRDADTWAGMRDAAVSRAALWDADAVFEAHWRPILAEMARPVVVEPIPVNRAARRQRQRATA